MLGNGREEQESYFKHPRKACAKFRGGGELGSEHQEQMRRRSVRVQRKILQWKWQARLSRCSALGGGGHVTLRLGGQTCPTGAGVCRRQVSLPAARSPSWCRRGPQSRACPAGDIRSSLGRRRTWAEGQPGDLGFGLMGTTRRSLNSHSSLFSRCCPCPLPAPGSHPALF